MEGLFSNFFLIENILWEVLDDQWVEVAVGDVLAAISKTTWEKLTFQSYVLTFYIIGSAHKNSKPFQGWSLSSPSKWLKISFQFS